MPIILLHEILSQRFFCNILWNCFLFSDKKRNSCHIIRWTTVSGVCNILKQTILDIPWKTKNNLKTDKLSIWKSIVRQHKKITEGRRYTYWSNSAAIEVLKINIEDNTGILDNLVQPYRIWDRLRKLWHFTSFISFYKVRHWIKNKLMHI